MERRTLKKKLYLCLMSVNALEAIRFYVSFACSFAFAERELMEGNAKIIRLIARDEALHLTGTQHMLNLLRSGADDAALLQAIQNTILAKPREHHFGQGSMPATRGMYRIGG